MQQKIRNLQAQAKKLPTSSGVYLFLDKKGKVLYVGRAVNLRRRALNYFLAGIDPRIKEMVSVADSLKHYKTDNLLEAIILEANLIKKHWPKYNVKDKDNRSFVYIVIPRDDYPKPFIVRERELTKFSSTAKVFGPFQNASLVKNALRIIRRIFPYSTCEPFSGKPCFSHQVGLCPGLCVGAINKKDYQNNIKNIVLLLSGQKKRLLTKLKKENPEQVRVFKHIEDASLIRVRELGCSKAHRIESYDVSHLTGKETYGAMVVFVDSKPDKASYRLFKIRTAKPGDDLGALKEVITRRFNHPEWPIPDLIVIDGGKPQISFVFKTLNSLHISIPLVGISKYGGDKLVFPMGTKPTIKSLAQGMKKTLLASRDEAHRFSLKSSRKKRDIKRK